MSAPAEDRTPHFDSRLIERRDRLWEDIERTVEMQEIEAWGADGEPLDLAQQVDLLADLRTRAEAEVSRLTAELAAARKELADAAREINCAGPVAHRIRVLRQELSAENARLTAALDRVRDDARITLRQIADFCDGEARAPHSAVYTAVRALEDARNLCLAALNDEPMDAARARLSLTCTKAEHIGDGFLHAANDDGPYDVDGIQYCGRCHGLEHPPASSDPTARTQPEGSNG